MRVHRSVAAVCLVTLAGCMTWKDYTVGPPPPELEARSLRVYTTDGSRTALGAAQVDNAYLVGESDGVLRSIPMDSIAAYEVRGVNAGLVFGVLVGIPIVVIGSYRVYCWAEDCSG